MMASVRSPAQQPAPRLKRTIRWRISAWFLQRCPAKAPRLIPPLHPDPAIRARPVLAVAALLTLAVGVALLARGRVAPGGGAIGLFTTLPILWSEQADVAGLLKSTEASHWARQTLRDRGAIVALDTLSAPGGKGPLDRVHRLVIAQPRPLSPAENVAVDAWVRGGGRLLLLADPALTAESNFAIGDPRRPQAVVLLSPILKRWGLELQFDEAQAFGEHTVAVSGLSVPVNLPGRLAVRDARACRAEGAGLVAVCHVGRGRVTALADAAVLDRDDPDGTRAKAFAALLDRAFAE
ncbi:MAG: ABC transporter [Proteobacteria bacterium]|nr:ABC transporter [Pseudomonadota bacterium]MDE2412644.1 ABC transporter [Sphingomonadales bacterium]